MAKKYQDSGWQWNDLARNLAVGLVLASVSGAGWVGINDRVASLTGVPEIAQVSFFEWIGFFFAFAFVVGALRHPAPKTLVVRGDIDQ
jgi:hypothetical protein